MDQEDADAAWANTGSVSVGSDDLSCERFLMRLIRATRRGSRTNKQICGHVRGKTCELIKTAHEPRVLRCIRCAGPRCPTSAMVSDCAWARDATEGGKV